jgi:hypothetical protein
VEGPLPPFGIDASACLDLKGERLYVGGDSDDNGRMSVYRSKK